MNRIRWGLVGCGDVARKRVAAAIQQEAQSDLVAACRRDSNALDAFCDCFGIEHAFTNANELFACENIDAVYIATPVQQHLSQTLAAAAEGKHVLLEKPMGVTPAECEQMIDACKANDVKLGVAYYRRFYPMVQRIEELLRDGAIGTPLAVSAVTATPMSMQPGEEGYWRAVPELSGGGALMDVGSHRINVFLRLFGEITEIRALCATVAADYQVEDTALLLMRFGSGVTGTLQCHFGCEDPDEFSIIGTGGRIVARPLNGDTLTIEVNGQVTSESHPPASNLCAPLINDFVAAIVEDRQPRVSGVEGWATNEVMERAYREAEPRRSHHF